MERTTTQREAENFIDQVLFALPDSTPEEATRLKAHATSNAYVAYEGELPADTARRLAALEATQWVS